MDVSYVGPLGNVKLKATCVVTLRYQENVSKRYLVTHTVFALSFIN